MTLQLVFNRALTIRASTGFGDERYRGFHDGAQGVQWHIAVDQGDAVNLAVNLEGLSYRGERPIFRFLVREARTPLIPNLCRALQRSQKLRIQVVREGWPGRRKRVYLQNREILDTDGRSLTDRAWATAVSDAIACMSADGGRGTQQVVRAGATRREEMNVLPHVTFGLPLWQGPLPPDAGARVLAARTILTPIHDCLSIACDLRA